MRVLPLCFLLLAACSVSRPVTPPSDHPASTTAAATRSTAVLQPLDAAPQPVLPTPLRPGAPPAEGAMDHASMEHHAHAAAPASPQQHDGDALHSMPGTEHADNPHDTRTSTEAVPLMGTDPLLATPPAGLRAALDAYLALHDALASDVMDGVAQQARALDASIAGLSKTPIEGHPHFWHARASDLAAVRARAQALASESALAGARTAFGDLSLPFVRLVTATGVPEGYTLAQFTCGMARGVPQGGVWMQRDGNIRNPFYGSAMLGCGSRSGAAHPAGH